VIASTSSGANLRQSGLQTSEWMATAESYDALMARVREGDLAPLETVFLTESLGLWDAWDAGLENLENREEFDALLDVRRARRHDVTPLPYGSDGR